MLNTIQKFVGSITNDFNHRYKSWEHCYQAFSADSDDDDLLALHLGFYLASWGMYRGSSGLLWKDYKIHSDAIKIIRDNKHLRDLRSPSIPDLTDVFQLFLELKKHYSRMVYFKNYDSPKNLSATDTLISKILLGTLGCMPAFDRYFNLGFFEKEYSIINQSTLKQIWDITNSNAVSSNILSIQDWLLQSTGTLYPQMKIIDMYYWQLGFDKPKITNNG